MKMLSYILAFCCLLSCTKPAMVSSVLERAERVMDARPDSALMLLENIPNPESLSERDYAVWGLLLTRARDKNYVPHYSDYLITNAIEYFRTHNDPQRLAWAYYYNGIIHYEEGELVAAQEAFFQAEAVAGKIADFVLLGQVYEHLGNIYQKLELKESVVPAFQKALEAKLKVGDSLAIGLAYRDIGRYYITQNLDSAECYAKQALEWLKQDPLTQLSVFNDLGSIYRRKQDYHTTLEALRQSLQAKPTEWVAQLKKQEREKAFVRSEQAYAEFNIVGWVIGMLTIVATCLVVLYLRRRKPAVASATELLRLKEEIESLQQQLSQQNDCDYAAEHLRQHYLKNSSLYCQLLPLMGRKREVKDFKLQAIGEKDWSEFYRQMDFVYAQFVTRLSDEYRLKDDYLKLACLILLNIYPCNAKNIYHLTSSGVTNKKNALAEKLGVSVEGLDAFLKTFSKGYA